MKCLFCPYVEEELKQRLKQTIEIYGEIPSLYFTLTEILSNCYCDKTGSKLFGGRCDDSETISEKDYDIYLNNYQVTTGLFDHINDPIKQEFHEEKQYIEETKIQRKRNRDKKYKAKAKRKYKELKHAYPTPFFPVGKDGSYESDENKIVRYKRGYNPPRAKFLRRMSNKKVRKEKDISSKGSGFKKVFDFWWNLW